MRLRERAVVVWIELVFIVAFVLARWTAERSEHPTGPLGSHTTTPDDITIRRAWTRVSDVRFDSDGDDEDPAVADLRRHRRA